MTRDHSGPRRCHPKILMLSQMQEQRRQLEEQQRKAEQCRFFIAFCECKCINFIPTGLTINLRQKIAEVGIIANKPSSVIDWTIISDIPDATILNEYMNINSQVDEWEDVIEDDGITDMQDEMDKTAVRDATLQTTILCVILIFLLFLFFSQIYYSAFGGSKKSCMSRSRLLRCQAAKREWATVVPSLVDPYLEWKSTCVTSHLETQSNIIWLIPVLGIKGL